MNISRRGLLASGAAGAIVAATDGAGALAADAVTTPLKKQELLLKGATVVSIARATSAPLASSSRKRPTMNSA